MSNQTLDPQILHFSAPPLITSYALQRVQLYNESGHYEVITVNLKVMVDCLMGFRFFHLTYA